MTARRVLLGVVLITSLAVWTAYAGEPDVSNTAPSLAESPTIRLDRNRLNFGAEVGAAYSDAQSFRIYNSGSGTLNWSASASASWMQVSPASGTSETTAPVGVGLDLTGLLPGDYTGAITISDPLATNSPCVVDVSLRVQEHDDPPFGHLDAPIDGSTVRGRIDVKGWVLDDIQISSVKIYHQDVSAWVYVADAVLVQGARPDVEQAYPSYPNNDRAGWEYSLLTHFLPSGGNGTYTLMVVATDASGHQVTLGTTTITVDNADSVNPFGAIDIPTNGAVVSGTSYRSMGWALTPRPNIIPTDGSTIDVLVDGVVHGHPVYGIYRSDIATLFPDYRNASGAFAYIDQDTTQWGNGVHSIEWRATDDGGNSARIARHYITVLNPSPVYTWHDDIYVDDDFDSGTPGWGLDHFGSIQDGIDAVISGGRVHVAAGSYGESVMLDRFVRVSLDGDAVLNGDLSICSGTFDASAGNVNLLGDFAYSGGTFDPGDRSVTFAGSGTQTISGDTAFWDVGISSGVVLETGDDVTVGGTLTNLGVTRETKTVSGTESIAFGLADVAIDVAAPGLTALQVERRDQNHPDAAPGIQTGRYWSFTPTGSDFTVSVTLPHNDIPGACDEVCRYTGTGGRWECAADSFDTVSNSITRSGITQLSDWATGDDTAPCRLALPMICRH